MVTLLPVDALFELDRDTEELASLCELYSGVRASFRLLMYELRDELEEQRRDIECGLFMANGLLNTD